MLQFILMLQSKNKANWKRMNRRGKKTVKNIENNRELKKRFVELGVFSCELRYEGCMGNTMLSFAHAKKRRMFTSEADWTTVVLACVKCHEFLDNKCSHEEMERRVNETISNRQS